MIRRVLSILIGLAGAALLYAWWQTGNEPVPQSLSTPATILADVGLADEDMTPETVAADETGGAPDVAPAGEDSSDPADTASDEASERSRPSQATAGWTPTLVEFDQSDRNAVIALLQRADAALAAGDLFQPAGRNAIDYFYTVLDAAPDNSRAKEGMERTLDTLARQIEAAFARGDYPEVAGMLPVMEQMRGDAAATIRARQRLEVVETQRLALQRAARAIERDRLDEGQRSAVSHLRQVLAEDPDNQTARHGLADVQRRLVEQGIELAGDGQFEQAEALLDRAARIDPDAATILDEAQAAVADRRVAAAGALFDQAHRELDNGDAQAAEALLEQAVQVSAEAPGAGLVRERIRNARIYGGYAEGERFRDRLDDGSQGPLMVVVPIGSFLMGSPDNESGRRGNEGPQFRVRLDRGFALAETETTVAQFRRFVDASGYVTVAERRGRSTIYDERSGSMRERRNINWRHDEMGESAGDSNPVVHIGWEDAAAYAAWLASSTGQSYRLPSEAEFEYALRAGSATRYPWGDDTPVRPLANVSSAGDQSAQRRTWTNAFPGQSDGWFGLAPVRSYESNDYGLHDLAGNASEWVEDCWHASYSRAPSDGGAWVNPGCDRRVARGASWASGPEQVRAAYRLNLAADTTNPRVGFRVARGF